MSNPATLAELKAALSGAPADFILGQLEAGASELDALKAWNKKQAEAIDAAKVEADKVRAEAAKEIEKAKAHAEAGSVPPVGGAPGEPESSSDGDPVSEWHKRLDAKLASGTPKAKAVSALVKEDSELHAAYLAAYNRQHGREI